MNSKFNFLMVTLDAGGNLPPMLGVAQKLVAEGHNVSVLTEPCLKKAVENSGLHFIPFREYFTRTDRKTDILKDAGTSPFTNPTFKNVIFGPAKTVTAQTLSAIKELKPDALIVDIMLVTALIAAEAAKIPSILIFHLPEYLPGPNRPPGGMGLMPGNNFITRFRDRLLGKFLHKFLNKFLPPINETRQQYNLQKLKKTADLMASAHLRLIQTLPSFDNPLKPAPKNVRYTGPVLTDPDWIEKWENPWPETDNRPLVVVAFSTTFQAQQKTLVNVIQALSSLPVRALVTLGPAIEKIEVKPSENIKIVASAPHSQVFKYASLIITHAGHGTIMRALANGVPLICLPMGRDQTDNATLVQHHGCGLKLSANASAEKIKTLIVKVLENSVFKKNAEKFKIEIATQNGAENAVHEIEKMMAAYVPKKREELTVM